jgi:hypothetical protein
MFPTAKNATSTFTNNLIGIEPKTASKHVQTARLTAESS